MYDFAGVRPKTAIYVAGLSGLIVATGFLAIRVLRGIGDFQYTHYHFNYADEFLRRGLVGEVLRLTGFPLTNFSVSMLYAVAVALFLLLTVLAAARVFADQPQRIGVLFVLFMLACPGLTLHYAYSSYGYLDIFQLLLAAFGLWIILVGPFVLTTAIAVCFAVASILIHEAGLILTGPVLITALILRFPDQITRARAAGFFIILLGVTVGVWRNGGADLLSFEDHVAAIAGQMRNPAEVSDAAILVLHRTLGDNVGLVLPRSVWWYVWQQVKFVILAAPYLIFFFLSLRAAQAHLDAKGRSFGASAMALAVFAPISLYPLGHDYFRWWSAAMTNFFLLTLFLTALDPGYLDRLATVITRQRRLMLLGIAIGLTMGGIGGLLSFSIHTAPAAMLVRGLF